MDRESSLTEDRGGNARRYRPTIRDVAKEAGVATSTVSRAFTNPTRVNEATREHVLEVARRLGYQGASPAAKAFIRGRTENIGLIVPDIANPHFGELIRGAALLASRSNRTVVIADTDESRESELTQAHRLAKSTDGIVLVASRLSDNDLRELNRMHPVVLVNRVVDSMDSVIADQRESIREVVTHLAGLGHRRVAYAYGPPNSWVARQRWRHLAEIAHECGVTIARIGPYAPYWESGSSVADEVTRIGATAVVAHNAVMSLGIVAAMTQRGATVPTDLSVVSLDDIFLAAHFDPAVTTRRANQETLGSTAISMLLSRLDAESDLLIPQRQMVPATLLVRQSTAPPRSVGH